MGGTGFDDLDITTEAAAEAAAEEEDLGYSMLPLSGGVARGPTARRLLFGGLTTTTRPANAPSFPPVLRDVMTDHCYCVRIAHDVPQVPLI